MTKLSVLMAVYNTAPDLLKQSIESILGQDFGDFEFLILDDGSQNPDTGLALTRYAALDARIVLRHEPHRGLTRTLNQGLAYARSIWIARQDADDYSAPRRLARQMAAFAASPELVLCGSNAWLHQQCGRPLWRTRLPATEAQIREALWRGNPFVHGATMFRLSAAREVGGYREVFPCSQDYDFFWRLAEAGRAVNLAEPLYHYRFAHGSVSAERAHEQVRVHEAARRLAQARERGEKERAEDAAAVLSECDGDMDASQWRGAAFKQADHILLSGSYESAFRAYLSLVRQQPSDWMGWAKLVRGAIFASVPRAREACFS